MFWSLVWRLIYIKKKRETRNTYEPHQETTTTEHQIPDLGQVQTIAAGLNVLMVPNLNAPLSEIIVYHHNVERRIFN